MRMSVTIRWAAIAMLICCMHGLSIGQTLDRPTTATSQSAPKRQGFFDYALGKINPRGIDYGASMEPSAQIAIATALGRVLSDTSVGRGIAYLDRMPTEMRVMAMRDAAARDTAITHTPEFVRFGVDYREVIQ